MKNFKIVKVLQFFLENPYDEVYLRELAKKLNLSPFAIKKYTEFLIRENLVKQEKKANLRYFKANIENLFFKYLKISFNVNLLLKSGLIDFLKDSLVNISSIVLFGSMAKGEDDKKSDVDIVIIGKEKNLDLIKFEDKIRRKINVHIFSWSAWNKKAERNKAFYYDVINKGIPLYGELPIVK